MNRQMLPMLPALAFIVAAGTALAFAPARRVGARAPMGVTFGVVARAQMTGCFARCHEERGACAQRCQ